MKIIDHILYLEKVEFIKPEGLVPLYTYSSLKKRNQISVLGRGGNGNGVLIKYESLPAVYKELVKERFGDPYEYAAKQPIRDLIQVDEKVRQFFENYEGVSLEYDDKVRYTNDAAILKAFYTLLSNKRKLKELLQISVGAFWQKACEIVVDVEHQYPNTLPMSERRLKPRYNDFVNSGFDCATLIDGRKYNTTNNKKVDDAFEWLIMSLFVQRHRPYKNEVYNDYLAFLKGSVQLVDTRTGELFDAEKYKVYGEMSGTTIWRILTKPVNMATVDKMRLNALDYSNKHLPYNERFAPQYSLSKLSMDDYEPPFKLPNGKRTDMW